MRLVIREYLSMLKESGGIDALLPDLLLAMGFDILSRPRKGSRQYGVDLAAVGIDHDTQDHQRKLFLFTIKRGDISRNDWNTGKNTVRPSLEDIQDSYLRTRVRVEHKNLPKKIILVTGGELKEDVYPDWVNYTHRYSGNYTEYGNVEFDFWGGDKLALLIQDFLFNEYIFNESAKGHLRKTIALADQNEDEPYFFYRLIEETISNPNLPKDNKKDSKQKRQQTLNVLNLSLNIVFYWCQAANNLRPAILCAEHTVIRVWDWIRLSNLFKCKVTREGLLKILSTYINIGNTYINKLQPHCLVKDGLFGYGADQVEYPLRTFEVIGMFGLIGVVHNYYYQLYKDEENRKKHLQQAEAIAERLIEIIENNPSSKTPRYDEHIIDITLGLLLLNYVGFKQQASEWIIGINNRIIFAYKFLGKHFPIYSDSYDQLVAMQFDQALPKEELMQLSTMLPILLDWYAILNLADKYKYFQQEIKRVFTSTDLQIWFPDETTDNYLYNSNAGYKSGFSVTSINLPDDLEQYKSMIIRLREQHQNVKQTISCLNYRFPILALISSRHFRTPIIPAYWQDYVIVSQSPEQTNNANE
ncbi:MAG TPA: hypothetical protein VK203_29415 [Nostocaceae cyanobacterium]|nr:hypothetical protein [Nostocaceae cyanobacterium]